MRPIVLHGHGRPLTLVKFNKDGDLLITCGKDKENGVNLWYTKNGERIGTYGGHNGACFAADITHDSQYLVTCGADSMVIFYETLTGKQLHAYEYGGVCKFVEFNQEPENQTELVICSDPLAGHPARIGILGWRAEEPTVVKDKLEISSTSLPQKAIKVRWGPADSTLISCHEEGTVMVWDAMTGCRLRVIEAHMKAVTSIQFSPNRMLMITSSKDRTAKLWDLTLALSGEEDEEAHREYLREYVADRPLNDACISPLFEDKDRPRYHVLMGGGQEARDVTTTGAEKGMFETCIYHLVTAEQLGQVHGHFGPMNTIAAFADGSGYVTGGEDGYVRLHHFDPDYFTTKRLD